MRIALVVARARNGVIGKDGALPWRMSSDLRHFKAATLGKPVLMGRRTWESLPRALPGRANIVVSRNSGLRARGAHIHSDLDAAIAAAGAMAAASGQDEICIIGGAALYAETLPRADRIVLTEVDLEPAGDARFPPFDETAFRETARLPLPRTEKDDADALVRVLDRV
jgi:dihydrofolate reductase